MIRQTLLKIGTNTIKAYNQIKKEKITIKDKKIHNTTFEVKDTFHKQTLDEVLKENSIQTPTIKGKKIIAIFLISSVILISIIFDITSALIISLIIIILLLFFKLRPHINKKNRTNDVLKELPYALRQMATELKAGLGLYDSMNSIAHSDYGVLSEEFKRTLEDIHYGDNYKTALNHLSKRVDHELMNQITNQIIRTLSNGGNLSNTLNTIAEESAYNTRIKYKEYSEKLNSFMLLYMFIAVLGPVVIFIMIIAATTVMGAIISPELLLVLYLFFFPMIISFIILFIKRIEPGLN